MMQSKFTMSGRDDYENGETHLFDLLGIDYGRRARLALTWARSINGASKFRLAASPEFAGIKRDDTDEQFAYAAADVFFSELGELQWKHTNAVGEIVASFACCELPRDEEDALYDEHGAHARFAAAQLPEGRALVSLGLCLERNARDIGFTVHACVRSVYGRPRADDADRLAWFNEAWGRFACYEPVAREEPDSFGWRMHRVSCTYNPAASPVPW